MTQIRKMKRFKCSRKKAALQAALLIIFAAFLIKTSVTTTLTHDTLPESSSDQELRKMISNTSIETSQRDFKEIARKTNTDKVLANYNLETCLKDNVNCLAEDYTRDECRPWGHFYDTIYNRWLKQYSTDDADPFQFLEIGYYNGKGFDAYTEFMPRGELHSMEISCLEPGPRSEGKWPPEWGNFAEKNPKYESLKTSRRLHCGDASDYNFLLNIWETEMKRPDAPPLKVVVDDGSHMSDHMGVSLFFWIPRIEPGGFLVMEDIQPLQGQSNKFRTHILPQAIKDLHWCGDSTFNDDLCFPTISPFIAGIHCEMHICVFVRNDKPAIEPSKEDSMLPSNAFSNAQKCLFGSE